MEFEKFKPQSQALETRYKRVFLKPLFFSFFSRFLFRFMLDVKSFSRVLHIRLFGRKYLPGFFLGSHVIVIIKDPFKKFLRQTLVISASLLIVTSIAPLSIPQIGFTADYFVSEAAGTDFIEEDYEEELPPFLMNEEGFVLKPSPISEEVSRIGFTDSVKHTVVPGDTLSTIAALYGISVKTLVWENNIAESAPLKIGQTLVIPSVDGVSHSIISKTENLSRIAKLYNVDEKLIREHNNIEGNIIQKGQKLFIPGGKKKDPVIVQNGGKGNRRVVAAANTFDTKIVMSSDAEPREGKKLIFPTSGKISQGFRSGHYAHDIANRGRPDVWATATGIVVTARGGCANREDHGDRGCGGGYGNYVVIDHGDGLQTLYGHLDTLYVTEGQNLDVGQAVGKMGNTGRSSGPHVHFEVIDQGVKRNPANYY